MYSALANTTPARRLLGHNIYSRTRSTLNQIRRFYQHIIGDQFSNTMMRTTRSLTTLVGYLVLVVIPFQSSGRISTSISRVIPRGGSSYPDSLFGSEAHFPQNQESVQDRVNAWKQQQMVGKRKHLIFLIHAGCV